MLREERKLRVFKNRVLKRIFGPKRDEVTGEWIRVLNDDWHALCSSPNVIRGNPVKMNGIGRPCST
jgi:hypothetical protein